MSGDFTNIASKVDEMAERLPYAPAIVFPSGRNREGKRLYVHYTFQQLKNQSDLIASGLVASGIGRGVRTALMVKPSLEFFALTFGIFKAGAVPVLVDPGIGIKSLKYCLREAEPEAFIGIPPAHAARVILGWARESLKTLVTVGPRWFWGGTTLEEVKSRGNAATFACARTRPDETAAILFTSGSTGIPKGVVYTHGTFATQVEMIRAAYDIRPGEIDLPTFPLFALFDPALGMTTIIPEMDATRPASVNPENIIEAIEDFGVTNMFGSPALLRTVARYCAPRGIRFPTLRRVISAGAPVDADVMELFSGSLSPGSLIHTPYGATESLPVATNSSDVILAETRALTDVGHGVCVGKPLDGIRVEIIAITDEPIEDWASVTRVPAGTIGEITVRGPVVTESYYNRPQSTQLAKIRDADGGIWHRMGDVGYFDPSGRLWFCGRKSHRVECVSGTKHSVPCEAMFNVHPDVRRTALVGVRKGSRIEPVLCVELEQSAPSRNPRPFSAIETELRAIAARFEHTKDIATFLVHPGFPVDIRHNAKIGREKLSLWARAKLK